MDRMMRTANVVNPVRRRIGDANRFRTWGYVVVGLAFAAATMWVIALPSLFCRGVLVGGPICHGNIVQSIVTYVGIMVSGLIAALPLFGIATVLEAQDDMARGHGDLVETMQRIEVAVSLQASRETDGEHTPPK